jgi:tyrosine decarboxylase / aspartate 1-decarboxylase
MKPREKFDREGVSEDEVRQELQAASSEDLHFRDGRILYSMCNEPSRLAIESHMMFIEANLGDPGLYPGTAKLERSVVNMLLDLLHGDAGMGGAVVSGGSEANITALWIYRTLTKKHRVVLPVTAHYSFEIAARMLGMQLEYVRVDEQFAMIPEDVEAAIDSKTAVVVAIAGTTEHGQIDPIERIQRICEEANVYLHIDAAFGGMVFPFLARAGYDLRHFDFNLTGVSSITVDPHKMGLATAPTGALLMRDQAHFDAIRQDTFYLSTPSLNSMLGTRSSAGVASAYAMMRRYGVEGYVRLNQECMKKAEQLGKQLVSMGYRLAIKPISPVVCVRIDAEARALDVQKKLREKRWRVSRTKHPEGIRVVMMPQVPEGTIPQFTADLHAVFPLS